MTSPLPDAIPSSLAALIARARPLASTSPFVASVLSQLDARGSLTDRQWAALERIAAPVAPTTPAAPAPVAMAAIETLFATARAAGLKRPQFRTEHLTISQAPAHGRNAGALYVKSRWDGLYLGKVSGGTYRAAPDVSPADALETLLHLKGLAADPVAAAVAYGRSTGDCGCCGRLLTDPVSVAAGIGPICAGRWGL